MITPEFMFAEFGNVIWKKTALLGELTDADAKRIVAAAQELPIGYYYTNGLLTDALEIALATKRTVYDSLYVALAAKQGCELMTDDGKLYESLQSTSLAGFLTLIENY